MVEWCLLTQSKSGGELSSPNILFTSIFLMMKTIVTKIINILNITDGLAHPLYSPHS